MTDTDLNANIIHAMACLLPTAAVYDREKYRQIFGPVHRSIRSVMVFDNLE